MGADFRSDTVTRPSQDMRSFMVSAHCGDDVYNEDPAVNELQAYAAAMFGKEASLFCASGTMTNQIAIKAHTHPGDELICSETAHIYLYEAGGIASNSGVQVRCLPGDTGGRIQASQVQAAINTSGDIHQPYTTLVCLENTTNKPGGAFYSLEAMQDIYRVTQARGVKCHLDGARLFNAMVASGHSFSAASGHNDELPIGTGVHSMNGHGSSYGPLEVGACFDSISVCLSKGLGCPIGSLLIGSHDFIARARRIRKAMGGGWRQAGFLAAAGLFALKHNVERLAQDHVRAKQLGDALASLSTHFVMQIKPVVTNIVIFELGPRFECQAVKDALAKRGILVSGMGERLLRLVCHLDIDDKHVKDAIQALKEVEALMLKEASLTV